MNPKCPRCQSSKVVAGKHFTWLGGGPQYFKPKELRLLTSTNHIPVKKGGFLACTDCGLLWSEVEAGKLREVLVQSGSKPLKARLGL
jgi:hypothetical protein